MNKIQFPIIKDMRDNLLMFSQMIMFSVIITITLSACGESSTVPDKVMVKKNREQNKKNDGTSTDKEKNPADEKDKESVLVEEDLSFSYTTIGKKDPFRSFFESAGEEDPEQKKLTPLQKIELEELSLVGVIIGAGPPYAMIQDAKGKGYVVTVGTLIGKNWGRISAITSQAVIVTEEYRDVTGKKVSNEFALSMPTDEQKPLSEDNIPETSKPQTPKRIEWNPENQPTKNNDNISDDNKSLNQTENDSNSWPPQGKPQFEPQQKKENTLDEDSEDLELSP